VESFCGQRDSFVETREIKRNSYFRRARKVRCSATTGMCINNCTCYSPGTVGVRKAQASKRLKLMIALRAHCRRALAGHDMDLSSTITLLATSRHTAGADSDRAAFTVYTVSAAEQNSKVVCWKRAESMSAYTRSCFSFDWHPPNICCE
jgi:hypothetical protein